MSPLSLRRYRADRLLRRDFYGLRPTVVRGVRRRLSARQISAEGVDLEACYAAAWQGLYATVISGQEIESPVGWLVVATFRRAIEDVRAAARVPAVSLHEVPAGAEDPDLATQLDDLDRLRHVFEALRGRLSQRECEAATLCYLQGLSRAEAARRMGISERRMRRLMEGAGERPGVAAKVGRLIGVVGRGGWCEEQASLMRGLAFGLLDPAGERHRLALVHQRDCPSCRRYVTSLRGLAAALPPVGIPLGAAAAGTAAAGAGAGAMASAGAGAGAGGGWLLAGGSLGAKLAAGCLIALGVGAGCVALTTPASRAHAPLRAAASRTATARHHSHSAPARSTFVAAHTSAVSPTNTAPRSAPAGAAPTATHRSHARREFGLETNAAAPASTTASTPTAYASTASTPTPARASTSAAPEPHATREFGAG